uniref:retinal cone rhodopsin-sensitive cGMP 3',5'-cyclic phosphodiesterase subunit gamma n=1 Tax=Euleptes europaea TaxID=460621 RepID=UPI00253F8C74|nr:retinal cone rhodopsin-sensitive cGMP 3',5'-cyclic phosphodiesterase subunit gamma [Euleptes europaea]
MSEGENAPEEKPPEENAPVENAPEDNTLSAPPPPPKQMGPTTPRKGPPKFKQRQTRQFKSKPPKKGVKGFGDDIPGMEGLGTDITVICPWEAFSHLELHELAQFGII